VCHDSLKLRIPRALITENGNRTGSSRQMPCGPGARHIHAAALADPDAQPATREQLARARRVVNVRLIRDKFGLTQEQFARRFGLRIEMVRGWEDKSLVPAPAAVTLLRVIWAEPDAVRRVVAAE
jgi:putative transcriptional regulator